jgi:hypothetical protein
MDGIRYGSMHSRTNNKENRGSRSSMRNGERVDEVRSFDESRWGTALAHPLSSYPAIAGATRGDAIALVMTCSRDINAAQLLAFAAPPFSDITTSHRSDPKLTVETISEFDTRRVLSGH